jgi:hypothetical protein
MKNCLMRWTSEKVPHRVEPFAKVSIVNSMKINTSSLELELIVNRMILFRNMLALLTLSVSVDFKREELYSFQSL